MNINFRMILAAGALISLTFAGCSKDDKEVVVPDPTPQTPSSSAPSITMNDGFGVLAAVHSVSYTTVAGVTIPMEVNTAVAGFSTTLGSGTFIDGGTVTLNTKGLTKVSNNAYVYDKLTDPLSLSTIAWNVTGSAAVPAISYTDNRILPEFSGFSSLPETITKSSGVTISLGSMVTNADSIYVVVTDYDNHNLIKRLGGNASQCAVTSAELSAFTAGQGMIQVCPWNYKSEDFSSKKFYFVLESAYTKMGITIN